MAEEQQLELKNQSGKKKLIIIIIAALLVLGLGGGAAWFMLSGSGKTGSNDGKSEEELAAEKMAKETRYVVMPSPFVFNVPGITKDRMVQIKMALLVRGPKNEALAKLHAPLIEGALLKVVTTHTADELLTKAGKEKLRSEALKSMQGVMTEVTHDPVIEQLLFTGFVMQ